MKTNFFRIGKKTLSIVIVMMMVISTMLVGTVTANAATTKSEPVGAGTAYYLWYKTANDNISTDMTQNGYERLTMETNGTSLSGTFDIEASTLFVAYINSDPDTITNDVVQFV